MNYRHARRVLGTSATATYTDIKRAFRRLALERHPDRNHSPDAREQFASLGNAYRFLMNHRSTFQKERYMSRTRGAKDGRKCFALVRLEDVPKQPAIA